MAGSENRATYYMPLSASSLRHGLTGPSPCTFSVPKVPYSKETQDFVKLLMKESKLTTTQKQGFQAVLRSGKNSTGDVDSERSDNRRDFQRRRAIRGRAMGLNMDPNEGLNVRKAGAYQQHMSAGRRSFDAIQASGALDPPTFTRTYVPSDKEVEKARFSHKMTYGNNPPTVQACAMKQVKKADYRRQEPVDISKEERFQELIAEIKDRVGFIESLATINQDKAYRPFIVAQIKEKLIELKELFPTRASGVVNDLSLMQIDRSLY